MRSDHLIQTAAAIVAVPLLLLGGLPLSGARPLQAAAQPMSDTTLTDSRITQALTHEYRTDPAVPSAHINVLTVDGIVTLRGQVPSLLASEAAVDDAKATRGVRTIVNELTVAPPTRTDAEIAADVREALKHDAATEAYEVTPAVDGGVVTLTGTVDSRAEQRLARRVAAGVVGVRAVKNGITVDVNAFLSRPDAEIEEDVEALLAAHVLLRDANIHVDVDHAQVRLTGDVGSAAERDLAYWTSLVLGVMSVNVDSLEVRPWIGNPMIRDSAAHLTNAQIKSAIMEGFLMSPRVGLFRPKVEVSGDGMVALTGTVGNVAARAAAERIARNTVGVRAVTNALDVVVENPQSDFAVADAVRRAFTRDPYLTAHDLTVVADDGVVTLTGTVESNFLRERAEDIAGRQPSVAAVVNMIDVSRTWATTSNAELETQVKNELFWNPWISPADVTVRARNGTVILSGTVDSWTEREQAEVEAYQGGARSVVNNLEVEPS